MTEEKLRSAMKVRVKKKAVTDNVAKESGKQKTSEVKADADK